MNIINLSGIINSIQKIDIASKSKFLCNFSLKIKKNENYQYIDCVAFDNLANEIVEKYKKNKNLNCLIVGELNKKRYKNRNGVVKYVIKVEVTQFGFFNQEEEKSGNISL